MVTIRFCDNDKARLEIGLRIITFGGPVIFTQHKWQYKVPKYILPLLDEQHVPYEIV